MTKLEICAIEDANPGQVYLYPEGAFYKAYQKSAWILCTKVHPFKVSSRSLKGLEYNRGVARQKQLNII